MDHTRTGSRYGKSLVAAVLCAALAACGPADSSSGVLQTLSSSAGTTTNPLTTASAPTSSAGSTSASTTSSAAPTTTAPPLTTAPPALAVSTIEAGVGKESIRYGDRAAFQISVRIPEPAADTDLTAHVTVLDGATVVAEGDTDSSGTTSLGFTNTADPGSKTYTVTWSGTALVQPSTAEIPVVTTQTDVDIAIDWTEDLAPGNAATIWVDVIGTPQSPTGTVTITYDGTQIASGPVDESGKISGTVAAVPAGDHPVKVSYDGDIRFQGDSASATLTVTEPLVNPAAAAAETQAVNPCPATASACVDLANTQAWLQSGGQITYGPVPITSGAAGSRTRTGTFEVFWRDKNHKSSLFNNAPMPNSVFFDGDIAFHQGSLYDQSNGCIHLSWDASQAFFDTLSVGKSVYVWGAPPY